MKTIFKKDLRENFKLALIGLAISTVLLAMFLRSATQIYIQAVVNQMSVQNEDLQPLLSNGFVAESTVFCAIFAAALGWFQARNEAHRDLWAFLVHRPITRTQIFWAKTAAGLLLYSFGAGLPLLGLVVYCAMPGHVAAPFRPAMIFPALACFLSGVPCYFAGMLTGLRQARWYASRAFGLGGTIIACIAVNEEYYFGRVVIIIFLVAAAIAIAVWGAYQSGGYYRGQPVFGKIGLALSLLLGSFMLLGLFVFLVNSLLSPQNIYRSQNYAVSNDGSICIETSQSGNEDTFTNLDGKPLLNPDTGRLITSKEFNNRRAASASVNSRIKQATAGSPYTDATGFFALWNILGKNFWYLDRQGKLAGFNAITRLPVGEIAAREAAGAVPFIRSEFWQRTYNFNPWNPPELLATASTLYHVNLETRKLEPFFSATPDDPILDFDEVDHYLTIVMTHTGIRLLGDGGLPILSLPTRFDPAVYPAADISRVNGTNSFVFMFRPDWERNEKAGWKLPNHILWVSRDGHIDKSLDLPVLRTDSPESLVDRVLSWLSPPANQLTFVHHRLKLDSSISLVPAALCALAGWILVRRHRFTTWPALAWLLFIFAFGIPGLLTFLAAQEWPRRETCPNCKKLRAVDRERCEHCGATFPPPDKIGIEIFEPIASP